MPKKKKAPINKEIKELHQCRYLDEFIKNPARMELINEHLCSNFENRYKEDGKYYIIPQKSHAVLQQGCVILKHGKENAAAKRFYEYISSAKAKAILKYFGYSQK